MLMHQVSTLLLPLFKPLLQPRQTTAVAATAVVATAAVATTAVVATTAAAAALTRSC